MCLDKRDCWMKDRCSKIDCNSPICIKFEKMNNLYDKALITDWMRRHHDLVVDESGTDLKKFYQLKDIQDNIVNFIKNGQNLYLNSTQPGNYKTSWTLRLVEVYFNNIWITTSNTCRALFINVPKYLLAIKDFSNVPNMNTEYVEHINKYVRNCDVVIWDDIGTKVATSWEHEHLLSIIDDRINNGLSNFYTSNLGSKEIKETLGDRLHSRIVNSSTCIEFKGKDTRKQLVKNNNNRE